MIYNIYSVRDQGWERSLVVARPVDRGRPEGDFVKWLGASEVPYKSLYDHTCVTCDNTGQGFCESDSVNFCQHWYPAPDLNTRPFLDLDLVQRELKKTYLDAHPLGKGTIARKVREKIHPPDLSRPKSWEYWAQITADAVLVEMKRRGFNTKHPLNRKHFEEAMLELWRI